MFNFVKIFPFILLSSFFIALIVALQFEWIYLFPRDEYFSILQGIIYVSGVMLLLLGVKLYSLKHNRDPLYLSTGVFCLLSGLIFPSLIPMDPAVKIRISSVHLDLIVVSILLLLTASNAGRIVPAKWRVWNVVLIPAVTIFLVIGTSLLLIYGITDVNSFLMPLRIVNALVFIWAGAWFGMSFHRTGDRFAYWLMLAVLFLFFASISLLFSGPMYDFIRAICIQLAILSQIWAIFEEQSRSYAPEIELRKSLEKSLLQVQQNLESYQKGLEQANAVVFAVDEAGQISFCNENLGRMLGMPGNRILGMEHKQLFDPADADTFAIEREKWASGLKSQYRIEFLSHDGRKIPVFISSVPIEDRLGRYRGSRHVAIQIASGTVKHASADPDRKVSDRSPDILLKGAEWDRQKSYYESLISGVRDALLVIDTTGNCVFINEYGKELLGYGSDELTRKKLPDFLSDIDGLRKHDGKSMNVEFRQHEAEFRTKSGAKILLHWTVRLLCDTDGKYTGALCVGRDISEYRRMKRELELRDRDLEQLVSERTRALELKVKQFSNILRVGEEIILNVDLPHVLKSIAGGIHQMGWKIVILSLRQEKTSSARIAASEGIAQNKIKKFMMQRPDLFENTLSCLKDEYRISRSYLIRSKGSGFIADFFSSRERQWRRGDAFICPIKMKNKFLGFIFVFEPDDGKHPDLEKTQVVEIFAQRAAVLIENHHLFAELEGKVREFQKANKIKSEFFTNMSHELRTPLNAILTLTSVLLQKLSGELTAEQLRQVRIIKKNGMKLLKLINDILDLSKIDAGRMQASYSYFPLRPVLEANVDVIRPLCERKGLQLELIIGEKIPKYIFSDKDKIDHVLTNILSNAIKFTDRGKISFRAFTGKDEKSLNITIKDTGRGIDKDDLPYIFEPFRQSGESTQKGTGLGLSISKEFWQMLDGEITVESNKGRGTEFHLKLPLKEVPETERETILKISGKRDAGPRASGRRRKGKRILIVDDNQDNQYALRFILEDKGYEVDFAENGQEGVNHTFTGRPSLIFMDMMMPGVDGYQATEMIRARKGFKRIPIIAMTAKTKQEDGGRALKVGCSDYLSKPFTGEDVILKIEKWI